MMQSSQVRRVDLQLMPTTVCQSSDTPKELPLWMRDETKFLLDWFNVNQTNIVPCTKEYTSDLTKWRICKNLSTATILRKFLKRIMGFIQTHMSYVDVKNLIDCELEEELNIIVGMYMDMELKVWLKKRDEIPYALDDHEHRITERILHWFYTLLTTHTQRIDTLLSLQTVYSRHSQPIFDPIFRKVLSEMPNGPLTDVSYVRYMLTYKLWRERALVIDDNTSNELQKRIIANLVPIHSYTSFNAALKSCLRQTPRSESNVAKYHMMPNNTNLRKSCKDFLAKCRVPLDEFNFASISLVDDELEHMLDDETNGIDQLIKMIDNRKARGTSPTTIDFVDLTVLDPEPSTNNHPHTRPEPAAATVVIDLTKEVDSTSPGKRAPSLDFSISSASQESRHTFFDEEDVYMSSNSVNFIFMCPLNHQDEFKRSQLDQTFRSICNDSSHGHANCSSLQFAASEEATRNPSAAQTSDAAAQCNSVNNDSNEPSDDLFSGNCDKNGDRTSPVTQNVSNNSCAYPVCSPKQLTNIELTSDRVQEPPEKPKQKVYPFMKESNLRGTYLRRFSEKLDKRKSAELQKQTNLPQIEPQFDSEASIRLDFSETPTKHTKLVELQKLLSSFPQSDPTTKTPSQNEPELNSSTTLKQKIDKLRQPTSPKTDPIIGRISPSTTSRSQTKSDQSLDRTPCSRTSRSLDEFKSDTLTTPSKPSLEISCSKTNRSLDEFESDAQLDKESLKSNVLESSKTIRKVTLPVPKSPATENPTRQRLRISPEPRNDDTFRCKPLKELQATSKALCLSLTSPVPEVNSNIKPDNILNNEGTDPVHQIEENQTSIEVIERIVKESTIAKDQTAVDEFNKTASTNETEYPDPDQISDQNIGVSINSSETITDELLISNVESLSEIIELDTTVSEVDSELIVHPENTPAAKITVVENNQHISVPESAKTIISENETSILECSTIETIISELITVLENNQQHSVPDIRSDILTEEPFISTINTPDPECSSVATIISEINTVSENIRNNITYLENITPHKTDSQMNSETEITNLSDFNETYDSLQVELSDTSLSITDSDISETLTSENTVVFDVTASNKDISESKNVAPSSNNQQFNERLTIVEQITENTEHMIHTPEIQAIEESSNCTEDTVGSQLTEIDNQMTLLDKSSEVLIQDVSAEVSVETEAFDEINSEQSFTSEKIVCSDNEVVIVSEVKEDIITKPEKNQSKIKSQVVDAKYPVSKQVLAKKRTKIAKNVKPQSKLVNTEQNRLESETNPPELGKPEETQVEPTKIEANIPKKRGRRRKVPLPAETSAEPTDSSVPRRGRRKKNTTTTTLEDLPKLENSPSGTSRRKKAPPVHISQIKTQSDIISSITQEQNVVVTSDTGKSESPESSEVVGPVDIAKRRKRKQIFEVLSDIPQKISKLATVDKTVQLPQEPKIENERTLVVLCEKLCDTDLMGRTNSNQLLRLNRPPITEKQTSKKQEVPVKQQTNQASDLLSIETSNSNRLKPIVPEKLKSKKLRDSINEDDTDAYLQLKLKEIANSNRLSQLCRSSILEKQTSKKLDEPTTKPDTNLEDKETVNTNRLLRLNRTSISDKQKSKKLKEPTNQDETETLMRPTPEKQKSKKLEVTAKEPVTPNTNVEEKLTLETIPKPMEIKRKRGRPPKIKDKPVSKPSDTEVKINTGNDTAIANRLNEETLGSDSTNKSSNPVKRNSVDSIIEFVVKSHCLESSEDDVPLRIRKATKPKVEKMNKSLESKDDVSLGNRKEISKIKVLQPAEIIKKFCSSLNTVTDKYNYSSDKTDRGISEVVRNTTQVQNTNRNTEKENISENITKKSGEMSEHSESVDKDSFKSDSDDVILVGITTNENREPLETKFNIADSEIQDEINMECSKEIVSSSCWSEDPNETVLNSQLDNNDPATSEHCTNDQAPTIRKKSVSFDLTPNIIFIKKFKSIHKTPVKVRIGNKQIKLNLDKKKIKQIKQSQKTKRKNKNKFANTGTPMEEPNILDDFQSIEEVSSENIIVEQPNIADDSFVIQETIGLPIDDFSISSDGAVIESEVEINTEDDIETTMPIDNFQTIPDETDSIDDINSQETVHSNSEDTTEEFETIVNSQRINSRNPGKINSRKSELLVIEQVHILPNTEILTANTQDQIVVTNDSQLLLNVKNVEEVNLQKVPLLTVLPTNELTDTQEHIVTTDDSQELATNLTTDELEPTKADILKTHSQDVVTDSQILLNIDNEVEINAQELDTNVTTDELESTHVLSYPEILTDAQVAVVTDDSQILFNMENEVEINSQELDPDEPKSTDVRIHADELNTDVQEKIISPDASQIIPVQTLTIENEVRIKSQQTKLHTEEVSNIITNSDKQDKIVGSNVQPELINVDIIKPKAIGNKSNSIVTEANTNEIQPEANSAQTENNSISDTTVKIDEPINITNVVLEEMNFKPIELNVHFEEMSETAAEIIEPSTITSVEEINAESEETISETPVEFEESLNMDDVVLEEININEIANIGLVVQSEEIVISNSTAEIEEPLNIPDVVSEEIITEEIVDTELVLQSEDTILSETVTKNEPTAVSDEIDINKISNTELVVQSEEIVSENIAAIEKMVQITGQVIGEINTESIVQSEVFSKSITETKKFGVSEEIDSLDITPTELVVQSEEIINTELVAETEEPGKLTFVVSEENMYDELFVQSEDIAAISNTELVVQSEEIISENTAEIEEMVQITGQVLGEINTESIVQSEVSSKSITETKKSGVSEEIDSVDITPTELVVQSEEIINTELVAETEEPGKLTFVVSKKNMYDELFVQSEDIAEISNTELVVQSEEIISENTAEIEEMVQITGQVSGEINTESVVQSEEVFSKSVAEAKEFDVSEEIDSVDITPTELVVQSEETINTELVAETEEPDKITYVVSEENMYDELFVQSEDVFSKSVVKTKESDVSEEIDSVGITPTELVVQSEEIKNTELVAETEEPGEITYVVSEENVYDELFVQSEDIPEIEETLKITEVASEEIANTELFGQTEEVITEAEIEDSIITDTYGTTGEQENQYLLESVPLPEIQPEVVETNNFNNDAELQYFSDVDIGICEDIVIESSIIEENNSLDSNLILETSNDAVIDESTIVECEQTVSTENECETERIEQFVNTNDEPIHTLEIEQPFCDAKEIVTDTPILDVNTTELTKVQQKSNKLHLSIDLNPKNKIEEKNIGKKTKDHDYTNLISTKADIKSNKNEVESTIDSRIEQTTNTVSEVKTTIGVSNTTLESRKPKKITTRNTRVSKIKKLQVICETKPSKVVKAKKSRIRKLAVVLKKPEPKAEVSATSTTKENKSKIDTDSKDRTEKFKVEKLKTISEIFIRQLKIAQLQEQQAKLVDQLTDEPSSSKIGQVETSSESKLEMCTEKEIVAQENTVESTENTDINANAPKTNKADEPKSINHLIDDLFDIIHKTEDKIKSKVDTSILDSSKDKHIIQESEPVKSETKKLENQPNIVKVKTNGSKQIPADNFDFDLILKTFEINKNINDKKTNDIKNKQTPIAKNYYNSSESEVDELSNPELLIDTSSDSEEINSDTKVQNTKLYKRYIAKGSAEKEAEIKNYSYLKTTKAKTEETKMDLATKKIEKEQHNAQIHEEIVYEEMYMPLKTKKIKENVAKKVVLPAEAMYFSAPEVLENCILSNTDPQKHAEKKIVKCSINGINKVNKSAIIRNDGATFYLPTQPEYTTNDLIVFRTPHCNAVSSTIPSECELSSSVSSANVSTCPSPKLASSYSADNIPADDNYNLNILACMAFNLEPLQTKTEEDIREVHRFRTNKVCRQHRMKPGELCMLIAYPENVPESNKPLEEFILTDNKHNTEQFNVQKLGSIIKPKGIELENKIQALTDRAKGSKKDMNNKKSGSGYDGGNMDMLTSLESILDGENSNKTTQHSLGLTESPIPMIIPNTADLHLLPDDDDFLITKPKITQPFSLHINSDPPKTLENGVTKDFFNDILSGPETKIESTPKKPTSVTTKTKSKVKSPNKSEASFLLSKYKSSTDNKVEASPVATKTKPTSVSPPSYIRSTRPSRMVTNIKRKSSTDTQSPAKKKANTQNVFDKLLEKRTKESITPSPLPISTENSLPIQNAMPTLDDKEPEPIIIPVSVEHSNPLVPTTVEDLVESQTKKIVDVNIVKVVQKEPDILPVLTETVKEPIELPVITNEEPAKVPRVELIPKEATQMSESDEIVEEIQILEPILVPKPIEAELKIELSEEVAKITTVIVEEPIKLVKIIIPKTEVSESSSVFVEIETGILPDDLSKPHTTEYTPFEDMLQQDLKTDPATIEEEVPQNRNASAVVEEWFNRANNQGSPKPYVEIYNSQTIEECNFFEDISNSSEMSQPTTDDTNKRDEKPYSSEYQTPDSGIALDEDSVQRGKHSSEPDNLTDAETQEPINYFKNLMPQEIQITDISVVQPTNGPSIKCSIPFERIKSIIPLLITQIPDSGVDNNKKRKNIDILENVQRKTIKLSIEDIQPVEIEMVEEIVKTKEHKDNEMEMNHEITEKEWSTDEVMSPSTSTDVSTPLRTKGSMKEYPECLFRITESPVPSGSCCINSPYPSDISLQEEPTFYVEGGIDLCTDFQDQYYESFDRLKEQQTINADFKSTDDNRKDEQQSLQAGYCVVDSQFTLPEYMNDGDLMSMIIENNMIIDKRMVAVNMHQVQPEMKPHIEDVKRTCEFADIEIDNHISGIVDGICRNLDNETIEYQIDSNLVEVDNEVHILNIDQTTSKVQVLIGSETYQESDNSLGTMFEDVPTKTETIQTTLAKTITTQSTTANQYSALAPKAGSKVIVERIEFSPTYAIVNTDAICKEVEMKDIDNKEDDSVTQKPVTSFSYIRAKNKDKRSNGKQENDLFSFDTPNSKNKRPKVALQIAKPSNDTPTTKLINQKDAKNNSNSKMLSQKSAGQKIELKSSPKSSNETKTKEFKMENQKSTGQKMDLKSSPKPLNDSQSSKIVHQKPLETKTKEFKIKSESKTQNQKSFGQKIELRSSSKLLMDAPTPKPIESKTKTSLNSKIQIQKPYGPKVALQSNPKPSNDPPSPKSVNLKPNPDTKIQNQTVYGQKPNKVSSQRRNMDYEFDQLLASGNQQLENPKPCKAYNSSESFEPKLRYSRDQISGRRPSNSSTAQYRRSSNEKSPLYIERYPPERQSQRYASPADGNSRRYTSPRTTRMQHRTPRSEQIYLQKTDHSGRSRGSLQPSKLSLVEEKKWLEDQKLSELVQQAHLFYSKKY